jgi:uncharacterized protein
LNVRSVAVAIICKTPMVGRCKTRLSPPLTGEECARLSSCFIRDLAATIDGLAPDEASGYAVYTPVGSETALRKLLPQRFRLLPQGEGNLGARLGKGISDLLGAGHGGAIMVNSDSPTLPLSILRAAVDAVRCGDNVVLGPALDGGYTLVGLSKPHFRLFADIPWSTPEVYRLTLERAREIALPVVNVPGWYDVDDEQSLNLLTAEFNGIRPAFADASLVGAEAPATRSFLAAKMPQLADVRA